MPVITHNNETLTFVWDTANNRTPQETILEGQSRASINIRCQYDKRFETVRALKGYSYTETKFIKGQNRKVLRRKVPFSYPYWTGLYCVGASNTEGLALKGNTEVAKIINLPNNIEIPGFPGLYAAIRNVLATLPSYREPDYLDARITLLFTTLPYRIITDETSGMKAVHNTIYGLNEYQSPYVGTDYPDEGDAVSRGIRRYCHRQAFPAGKFHTVPGQFLYYKALGVPIPNSSAVFFQPAMDIRYDWFHVPEDALPVKAWNYIPGTVNAFPFDGFPAESLLCMQPSFKQETGAFGYPEFTVTYTMRFLPNWDAIERKARGHNWFFTVPHLNARGEDPGSIRGKLTLLEVCTRGTSIVPFLGHNIPVLPMNGDAPYAKSDFRFLFRPDQPETPVVWKKDVRTDIPSGSINL